ncbi:MAG: hypothetical protein ACOC29_01405 [Candidatus Sumerlaeota bacterium]
MATAVFVLSAATAPAKGVDNPEEYLSGDTAVLVTIPNVSDAVKAWQQTATGQMWDEPAMAYWYELRLLPAISGTLEGMGLDELPEILKMAEGQMSLAIELPDLTEPDPNAPPQFQLPDAAIYLMVDFGENSPEARRRIESFEAERVEYPIGLTPKIPYMILHTPPTQTGHALASAWVDNTWVAATSGAALRDLLSRRINGEPILQNRRNVSAESLEDSDFWKTARKHFTKDAAIKVFADDARLGNVLLETAKRNAHLMGYGDMAQTAAQVAETFGMMSTQWTAMSIEMRDAAFYTRTVLKYDPEAQGLMVPEPDPKPLEAIDWFTFEDYDSFTATSIASPIEYWNAFKMLAEGPMPQLATRIETARQTFQMQWGLELEKTFDALGDQYIMASKPSSGIPNMVVLWELTDREALNKVLETVSTRLGFVQQQRSYKGRVYTFRQHPKLATLPIFTTEIDGWFVLTTRDQWVKDLVDRREYLAMDKDQREGIKSGTPIRETLSEPFGKAPGTVTSWTYSNLKPSIIQLGTMLPILPSLMNLQLAQLDMPKIPGWVPQSLPPLVPVVKHITPTIVRQSQNGPLTIKEKRSAIDPLATPALATGFVIWHRYQQESAAAQTPAPAQ